MRRLRVVAALVVALAVGVALGESLDNSSAPSGTQSLVRTLDPLPLAPAARSTVTVTVPSP